MSSVARVLFKHATLPASSLRSPSVRPRHPGPTGPGPNLPGMEMLTEEREAAPDVPRDDVVPRRAGSTLRALAIAMRPSEWIKNVLVFAGLVFRSEEHTSELQSHSDLVCRLLP